MHLPKFVYEYAPHYWIIVGVLLMLLGFRVGSDGAQTFQYFAVSLGALSSIWGARVFLLRRAQRMPDSAAAPPE